MIFEIDHLGIAVADLEKSLAFYRDILGATVASQEFVPHEKINAAILPAGGSNASIELLEATDPDSPIAKFIARRGPGLHHIALRVDDLSATAAKLRAAGYEILDELRVGAGGHLYVFVHPRSTGGVLLELVEQHAHS